MRTDYQHMWSHYTRLETLLFHLFPVTGNLTGPRTGPHSVSSSYQIQGKKRSAQKNVREIIVAQSNWNSGTNETKNNEKNMWPIVHIYIHIYL